MKVRIKLSGSEYKTFGMLIKTMLDVSSNKLVDSLERINMIEGCEKILQKISKDLMTCYKKKYTIVLSGWDCHIIMLGFDVVMADGKNGMPPYETACWYEITKAIYDEANALLRHRENVRGNLEMRQLN